MMEIQSVIYLTVYHDHPVDCDMCFSNMAICGNCLIKKLSVALQTCLLKFPLMLIMEEGTGSPCKDKYVRTTSGMNGICNTKYI